MSDAGNRMRRREFINVAAASAVLLASGPAAKAVAKSKENGKPSTGSSPRFGSSSKIHVCNMCGHVEFGNALEFCPVCHAEERFEAKDLIFTDAMAKLKDGGAKHTPVLGVQEKSTLLADVPCKEVHVRVGATMHESDKANHIHFIDFYLDGVFFTRFFASPQMQPAVVLFVRAAASKIRAVSYCNMHGFWQAEAAL